MTSLHQYSVYMVEEKDLNILFADELTRNIPYDTMFISPKLKEKTQKRGIILNKLLFIPQTT